MSYQEGSNCSWLINQSGHTLVGVGKSNEGWFIDS